MFGSAKPLASLSSGLLARKGQARPAMRRQGYDHATPGTGMGLDDLGWNDMGFADQAPVADVAAEPVPPVLAEREELVRQIERVEPVPEPAPVEPPVDEPVALSRRKACRIARESAEQTARGKAAFTLRLDPDRHLRLRLASAVGGRSAQLIVADALDRFLQTMPEVEALAAQLPTRKMTA